jgi:hypothetical protein
MMDQSAAVATQILAARAAMSTADPEPQIAARALLGLWRVQADSLRRHLHTNPAPAQLHELVTADVRRAAQLIDTGLRSFAPAKHLCRTIRGACFLNRHRRHWFGRSWFTAAASSAEREERSGQQEYCRCGQRLVEARVESGGRGGAGGQ